MPLSRTVLEVAPSGLAAQVVGSTQINLSWSASLRAISYRLYRGSTLIYSNSTPSYNDTGLTASTLYSYQISAVGSDSQEGPKSSIVSATTQGIPVDNTPTQFTFTDLTGQSLGAVATSAAITISGLTTALSITLSASGGTIDKNGNGLFAATQSVQNGDTVRARVTCSGSNSTSVDCVVTALPSGVADTFSATTVAGASGFNFVELVGTNTQYDLVAANPTRFNAASTACGNPFAVYDFGYACNGAYGTGALVPGFGSKGSFVMCMQGGDTSARVVDAVIFDFNTLTWRLETNIYGLKNHVTSDHYPLTSSGPNLSASSQPETSWAAAWSTDGRLEYAAHVGVPKPSQTYRIQVGVGGDLIRLGSLYPGAGGIGQDWYAHKYVCSTKTWTKLSSNSIADLSPTLGNLTSPEPIALYDATANVVWYLPMQISGMGYMPYLDLNDAIPSYKKSVSFSALNSDGFAGAFPPGASGVITYGHAALFNDGSRRCILWFTGYPDHPNARAWVMNLNSIASGWQSVTLSGSIAHFNTATNFGYPIAQTRANNWAQYPADNCLYTADGVSGLVSRITPPSSGITGTWTLTTLTPTGSTLPQVRNGGSGIDHQHLPHYTRWVYVAPLGKFALVGGGAQPVALYTPPDPGSIGLPILTLTSGTGSGTYGWTAGHAFQKGEVVATSITAVTESLQCDIRNYWNDGSVKYAILSGVSSLTPSKSLQLTRGTSATGTAIAESRITTVLGGSDVVVTLGSFGAVSLAALVGTSVTTTSSVAGRVRTAVSGPVMSEFHYMGIPAGGDTHLRVWFYVRVYSNNAMEVETVVENGWFQVASPATKTYSPTVSVNGVTVYSPGSITHRHRTKWIREDWFGTNPQIVPLHDMAYLRSTKMVPNYGGSAPSNTVLNDLYQTLNPTPFTELGDYNSDFYGGGDKDGIGLLPHWASCWGAAVTTPDARAVRSCIANARVAHRYAVGFRDETTLRPPKMATTAGYANYGPDNALTGTTQCGQNNAGASISFIPSVNGSFPADQICDRSHAPQDFYAAYLISGRWSLIDAAQTKQINYAVIAGSTARNYNDCRFSGPETRGRGWVMRDCALALAMTPDSDSFLSELQTIWANNMAYQKATYATVGAADYDAAGWFGHYSATGDSAYGNFSGSANSIWWDVPWMHWFNCSALGLARDLELNVGATPAADLITNFTHYVKILAGPTSDGSGGSPNYRRCIPRDSLGRTATPVGTDAIGVPLNVSYTWAQIWASLNSELALPALPGGTSLLQNDNTELVLGDFDCTTSNGGHFFCALGLAATYDSACAAGYARLQASSTWASRILAWQNVPKSSVRPRT